ncbi:hypothetical protein [Rhizobium phage RHph_X66]|nr:hypothetical protein [Rhizobium phage RHph_X66]
MLKTPSAGIFDFAVYMICGSGEVADKFENPVLVKLLPSLLIYFCLHLLEFRRLSRLLFIRETLRISGKYLAQSVIFTHDLPRQLFE